MGFLGSSASSTNVAEAFVDGKEMKFPVKAILMAHVILTRHFPKKEESEARSVLCIALNYKYRLPTTWLARAS